MTAGLETVVRALGLIASASETRGETGCNWRFKNITSASHGEYIFI